MFYARSEEDAERIFEEETVVDISVVKVWEDCPGTFTCPGIEIQLIKDSTIFDTVTLNTENNWKHTWSNLSSLLQQSIVMIVLSM